jgi:thiol-disulfide isomerase/thioredoxin
MKKITILIVLAVLCLFFSVHAQQAKLIRPLNLGDTVPDIVVPTVLNFKTKTLRLSDYKDKLIIIDFWAMFCSPCIGHMPTMYAMQQKHREQLLVMLDNPLESREAPNKIQNYLIERKKAFDLPSVISDSVLYKLFHPASLGIYTWIKNGRVIAYTESEDVTEENVQKLIANENPNFHQVYRITYDRARPLFINNNGGSNPSNYVYRSIIFPFIDGVFGNQAFFDDSDRYIGIARYDQTILSLIYSSHPKFYNFSPAYRRIKVRHPEDLPLDITTDSLKRKYIFNYEAIFPPTSEKRAHEMFQEDIARYFPYRMDSVKLKDSCWVLSLSKRNKIITKGQPERATNYYEHSGLPIYFHNSKMSEIVRAFEGYYKIPFIDETGYDGKLWLIMPVNQRDMAALAKSLEKQGVLLTKQIRELTYAVVTDKDSEN